MQPESFKFGEFVLDCDRYQLLRGDRPIKIERIPMELLILLVKRDGHLVTRQEIVASLWGPDVFVDAEHGVNTAVRKIRQALKDDPEHPCYIETVTGKGYRFIARKRSGSVSNRAQNGEKLDREFERQLTPAPLARIGARPAWVVLTILSALLVSVILFASNMGGLRHRVFGPQRVGPVHSIAVLPLENLSGDPSQDYYADGMTDELTTALARNASLRVVSRTSAMQFKGVNKPLHEIAQSLGVDGILEGSVSRSGDRIHMNLQLIYVPTDTHMWAQTYDGDLNSAMSLAEDFALTIAAEAKVEPVRPKRRRPVSPEAHDAYLRGRYLWLTSENTEASRTYFEKAIQLQPDYAVAWSGLADSYAVQAVALQAAPPQLMEKVEQAARHALELDDSLPEAHNSLAAFYLFGKWELKKAEAEVTRAIDLNPNSAEAHHLNAYVLMAMQRSNEALEEEKRSSELDPVARPWGIGYVLIRLHRIDDAIQDLRLRAEAQPKDSGIRFNLSDAYWLKGMWADSIREAEAAFLNEDNKKAAHELRRAFESGGRKAAAEWWLKLAKSQNANGYVSPLALAIAYAQAENKGEALKYLEQAYEEHSSKLVFLQNNPIFDFLHSDERYRTLVRKMGLPPAWN